MSDEVAEAAANALADDPQSDTRRWLLETLAGTLCTTTVRRGLAGYPFGSVVPFALTGDGRPFILIAGIAAHTANLRQDPRASLFVRQPEMEGDPQKGWRITIMGKWAPATEEESTELHARYVERVPRADGYLATHDFHYWVMREIEAVRYIGGFGKICWLPGEVVTRDPVGEGIADARQGAIDHMNEDHAHNMVEMCAGLYGFTPERAQMKDLDRTGLFVQTTAPDRLVHFSFGREISSSELRHAVVEVLQRARNAS